MRARRVPFPVVTITEARARPGLLARGWRSLRRMRTAIILLLLVAAAAGVGSLFPQRAVDPRAVEAWTLANPRWVPAANALSLFDVYGAWWFMGLYGLLLVSLGGCLVPRYRAFWRQLRSRPEPPTSFETQPLHASGTVPDAPEDALARASVLLRAKRFRVRRDGDVVAAEKGHLREGGSLVFHSAFFILLIGSSVGQLFGYTGQVGVVEGERVTDTAVEYDYLKPGRFFGDHHTGFSLELTRFGVAWYPNGVPKMFASDVIVREGDRIARRAHIEVNKPLTYRGRRIYQLSWGWAPVVRVTQDGRVLYDGPTVLLQTKAQGHRGVIKLPGAKPQQVGIDLQLFTDPEPVGSGDIRDASPEPRNPVIVYERLLGDLGLSAPQSVYRLDRTNLVPAGQGIIRQGNEADLGNGLVVAFVGLRRYSVLQIASNPGLPLLALAAICILVGLIPALYASRRRVWVRASSFGEASTLQIAGRAFQRQGAFEEEFARLARSLGIADGQPTERAQVGVQAGDR